MAKISHIDTRILGVILVVVCGIFGTAAVIQNSQIQKTQDCMIAAFSNRDEQSQERVDAAVHWLNEFIAYLENIQNQTSAEPLIKSAKNYKKNIEDTGETVSVTSLEECQ